MAVAAALGCSGPATLGDGGRAVGPEMALVSSEVVVDHCPEAKRMNARQAQASIQRLVEPCSKVPGGAAHFSATLLPGGRIELASPSGDPAEGVVPTCVLQNRLAHRMTLTTPCKLDVRLEERLIAGPSPAP